MKNRNKLEVYVSHGVNKSCQTPRELEFVLNVSDSRVGEESLNPINKGGASYPNIQPYFSNFPSNHPSETFDFPNEPSPSTIPSNPLNPAINEDPNNDDLEDDLESVRNTSEASYVDNDVHQ